MSWAVAFVLTASQSILGDDETITGNNAANPIIRRIWLDTLNGGGVGDRITFNDQSGPDIVGRGPGIDAT